MGLTIPLMLGSVKWGRCGKDRREVRTQMIFQTLHRHSIAHDYRGDNPHQEPLVIARVGNRREAK